MKSLNSVAVTLAATAAVALGALTAVAPHAPTGTVAAAESTGTGDTNGDSGWGGRIANGFGTVTAAVSTTGVTDGAGV
ncbi:hypothetical protein JCM4814A_85130 [Streptomyces phaeofaciens JCM 4814]|uniref:Secreted protein n=1 Tax=Streptomyces phaeofaciens TaxID=68254 RepID=A0A918H7M9_9ACTN|nr:hypothetical protein [Streptomyces phaeofaciens]GGT44069.1 hypothetical protein GCM10010226_20710 [Streptomyces phaeofaciens]